jgi:hypothetical protein
MMREGSFALVVVVALAPSPCFSDSTLAQGFGDVRHDGAPAILVGDRTLEA